MSFKALKKTIDKLFSDNIFEILRNQRKYVWNKNNWNELLTDLELSIKSSTFHFIGSIVLKEEKSINNINRYSIIDGQQRTIKLVLCSLLRSVAENDKSQLSFSRKKRRSLLIPQQKAKK